MNAHAVIEPIGIGVSAYRQLKPMQRVFVDAYIGNLQTSAVAAGQSVQDYVKETARRPRGAGELKTDKFHADQMMSNPLVRVAISERVKELTEHFEVNAMKVLKEVANIAFSSMGHYMEVDEYGQPNFDLTKCTPEQLACISSVEITESGKFGNRTFKFKLHDKLGAIDKLMRVMGMFEADNEQLRQPAAGSQRLTRGTSTNDAANLYQRTLKGARR